MLTNLCFNLWTTCFLKIDFKSLGCYKDNSTSETAIPSIEGKDLILDGSYLSRNKAITKCAVAARRRGFKVFALRNRGLCATSAEAENTYNKYGKSSDCKLDGEGGPSANHVYIFEGLCFNIMYYYVKNIYDR